MTLLLGLIILFCILLVLFYVGRTVELTAELNGTIEDTEKSSNVNGTLLLGFLIAFFIGIAWSAKIFLPRMLPSASSAHGVELDKLFNLTLVFTGIVFILTHILLFWFAFRYREKKTAKSYFFPHNNLLELIWTAIPAIVMVILVAKGMIVWINIFPSEKDMPKDKLVIEVTAQQFKWTFRYPGKDGNFGERIIDTAHVNSNNELGINWDDKASHDDFFADTLYLIKNKPVLVKLGALDVLHSFYLPHFRVKMDCVPGVPTKFYFVPTQTTAEKRQELSKDPEWQKIAEATGQPKWMNFMYELACTELCGKSHFAMQRYVMVVEQKDYDLWLASHPPAHTPMVAEVSANPVEMVSDSSQGASSDSTHVIAMKN